jgi:hypothetical protein
VPVAAIGWLSQCREQGALLLLQQAVGLRIVRMEMGRPAAETRFLVSFQGATSGRSASRLDNSEVVPIPFTGLPLALAPLLNLSIEVQHGPRYWLLWPALALLVLGAGLCAAGGLCAQIAVAAQRAVITLPSDLRGEMASLQRWYNEQQPEAPEKREDTEKHPEKHI